MAGAAAQTVLAAIKSAQQELFENNNHSNITTSSSAIEQRGPFDAYRADTTADYLGTHAADLHLAPRSNAIRFLKGIPLHPLCTVLLQQHDIDRL
ncbi:MAG: hypothetical protein ALECFALPRED_011048 [Alectoria fallacina]|uniref:Uncharacterized protein n=1 Tax=Alectoria fallacina TaxID=1903189 RepID=A0A8H3FAB0_9LECA|nr:MAG: hypothetical protein ALECFALPRED_011048 [Alectoria fallacina]